MSPSAFRVVQAHQTAYTAPLAFRQGERLRFERRETEWPGWIWCTDSNGQSAWVPERWVEIEGDACVLQRDYVATELPVQEGEIVTVERIESGWGWGIRESGEQGWVPLANLSPLPYALSEADQIKMLRKLMLYWDGQWFLKAVEAFGLEAAIRLNAEVRAAFGRIEMRMLLKTVGKERAADLVDALRLLDTYAGTFLGGGIRSEFAALDADRAEVIVRRCAAYEGAKRAALPRQDQACVACEGLWNAWLETLLPGARVHVRYPLRLGMGDPQCLFQIQIEEETT
jgi:hypothetical protein